MILSRDSCVKSQFVSLEQFTRSKLQFVIEQSKFDQWRPILTPADLMYKM